MVTRTQGNTTTYALTLLQLTFVNGNEQTTEFTPLDTDVVSVVLHGATGAYTYSPTIVDNVLYFTDTTGSLPSGSYDAEVLIDRADGTQLRAMERSALLVVYADGDALAYSTEAKLSAQMFIVQSASTADLENRVSAIETSGLITTATADATKVVLQAADTTDVVTLPTATTTAAGVMSAAQVTALENANAVIAASSVVYNLSMLTDATTLTEEQFSEFETAYTAIAAETATAIAYNGICIGYDFSTTTYTLVFAQYDNDADIVRYVESSVSRISGNHAVTNVWREIPTTALLADDATATTSEVSIVNENNVQLFALPTASATQAGVMTAAQASTLASAPTSADLATKADATSVPNGANATTTAVSLQNNGADLFALPTASTTQAGTMSAAQVTALNAKADAPTLSVQSTAPATLTPTANTYTRIDTAVGTMSVTLPAISAGTFSALSIAFTSSTTPAVTFTTADGKSIVYASDFAIDAETTYEISALFNGVNWVLAYVTFD